MLVPCVVIHKSLCSFPLLERNFKGNEEQISKLVGTFQLRFGADANQVDAIAYCDNDH
jgi:hypothetical protein